MEFRDYQEYYLKKIRNLGDFRGAVVIKAPQLGFTTTSCAFSILECFVPETHILFCSANFQSQQHVLRIFSELNKGKIALPIRKCSKNRVDFLNGSSIDFYTQDFAKCISSMHYSYLIADEAMRYNEENITRMFIPGAKIILVSTVQKENEKTLTIFKKAWTDSSFLSFSFDYYHGTDVYIKRVNEFKKLISEDEFATEYLCQLYGSNK